MKRNVQKLMLAVLLLTAGFIQSKAQIVDIATNNGTSSFAVFGNSNYSANECIYTDAEIGTFNFTTPATAILKIAYNVQTGGVPTSFNNVNIYMKDVPLSTTTFTGGTYDLAGYTLVYTGGVTLGLGWTDILLTNPYVRTPGTNLQVLLTRTDNVVHTGFIYYCSNGNSTNIALTTTRRYNGTVPPAPNSTALAVTAFRQSIRLKHTYPNDAGVSNIYTLGKLPLPNADNQVITANISNTGDNALTNINVTLDITGANTFTNTQVIPSLAIGASTIVTFPAATFTNTGINNVSVYVPSDDNTSNDFNTVTQTANANTWSYAYGQTPSGGVGFNPGVYGDFVARFNTNATTFLTQISVNFTVGNQPFKIGIWDATGVGGTPGTLVWESPQQTSTAGVYVMPVLPAVSLTSGDFFVGVRQLPVGTANVSFAYQTESPIRPSTFYYTSQGTGVWIDFAPASPFRFMIEPKLILGTDASLSSITFNPNSSTSCGGTQSADIVITNTGAATIGVGTASVTLNISGANTYSATLLNTTSIPFGSTETLTFTGISIPNQGTNFDTAYVVLPGDGEDANDTLKTSQQVLPSIASFPAIRTFRIFFL